MGVERATRKYTMELIKKSFIGAQVDCLGPDMGTNEQVMTWIKDTYKNVKGESDIDNASSYSSPQMKTFGNVLSKPPEDFSSRGFSSNSCSSCSFCMKNTCACKSSNCVTCVTGENLPKRGWSSRGPPEEIYKYF